MSADGPWHLLPSSQRWMLVAERITEKLQTGVAQRMANELHAAYKRGRQDRGREVRQEMYALGAVDNAARLLLADIDNGRDFQEAVGQLRRVLIKSPSAAATPYPLEVVTLIEEAAE